MVFAVAVAFCIFFFSGFATMVCVTEKKYKPGFMFMVFTSISFIFIQGVIK